MNKIIGEAIERLFTVQMILLFLSLYLINTYVIGMPFIDAIFILLMSILVSFIVFFISSWRTNFKGIEEKLE